MSEKNYKDITRPYNNLLNRTTDSSSSNASDPTASNSSPASAGNASGGGSPYGDAAPVTVKTSGNFDDIWIKSYIRSDKWKPKEIGFYIDGRIGYAEFANVFVSGEIEAKSGSILGDFFVGEDNPITISGTKTSLESANYVSGAFGSGFHLDPELLEVGNIACRGIFRSAVFQKDIINAVAGSIVITPNSDSLDADMTAADDSTLKVKGTVTLAVGDILRIKEISGVTIHDEWMRVTGISNAPTYSVARDLAGDYDIDSNPKWKKGVAVVDYGETGAGGVYLTASDSNAPYISIFDHTGDPWDTLNTRVRIGNLNGYLGYATDLYGIAIGESDKYLKYDSTNGLQIKGKVTATSGEIGGWTINSTSISSDSGKIKMDSANNRFMINDGTNDRVLLGKLTGKF